MRRDVPGNKPVGILEAAKLYLANGFSVIPITPNSKLPDGVALADGKPGKKRDEKWGEFCDRLPDEDELQRWFGPDSDSIIAIVTGYRGLTAIDFDDMEQFRNWALDYPDIAEGAPLQVTRKGVHLFLRCRRPPNTAFWPHDLVRTAAPDSIVGSFKGRMDYVVAWPSAHISGGNYQWAPGRSPWECEPPEINDFRDIGFERAVSSWRLVFNGVLGLIAHPLETLQCIRYFLYIMAGRKNHQNLQWKPREYWARLKIASLRNEKSRKRNWILEDEGPGRS